MTRRIAEIRRSDSIAKDRHRISQTGSFTFILRELGELSQIKGAAR